MVAIRLDFFSSEASFIAITQEDLGHAEIAKPHERVDMTVSRPYLPAGPNRLPMASLLNPVSQLRPGNAENSKKPGMDLTLSRIAPIPPAVLIPIAVTAHKAQSLLYPV